jgi:hypothetical protein
MRNFGGMHAMPQCFTMNDACRMRHARAAGLRGKPPRSATPLESRELKRTRALRRACIRQAEGMAAARRVQRICRHVVATAPATRRESPAAPPAGLSASSSAVISVAAAAAPPRPRIDPVVVTLRGDAGRANGLPGTNELSRTVTIRSLKPTDMVAALAFCRRLLWRDRWHYNPMESTVRLQVQNSGRRFVSGGGVHLVLVETRVEEYDGKRFEYEEIYGEAMYSWPVRQTRNGKLKFSPSHDAQTNTPRFSIARNAERMCSFLETWSLCNTGGESGKSNLGIEI